MTKNQNKCWYNTGFPPPAGSKNVVLKFLSVNNMVIPPANTGRESNNKIAVVNTDQTNKGNRWKSHIVNSSNKIDRS